MPTPDAPRGIVHRPIESFEKAKDTLLRTGSPERIRREAYAAARHIEVQAEEGFDPRGSMDTINNCTALLVALADKLATLTGEKR